ncbi:unnamed protein product [Chironomus riparius]|uniref:Uncharacterized protein n=1 Tax=Chironomus riparius TaxID=315576 RepID=A0A9N9S7Q8_9DIPT|nr:unnamed protein product [Chironomus riparius]
MVGIFELVPNIEVRILELVLNIEVRILELGLKVEVRILEHVLKVEFRILELVLNIKVRILELVLKIEEPIMDLNGIFQFYPSAITNKPEECSIFVNKYKNISSTNQAFVKDLIAGNAESDFLPLIIKLKFSAILQANESLVGDDESLLTDLIAGADYAANCVVKFILNIE